ncbi:MAG: MarR family winged helix-turn-helix transcriptional regulator [Solirubrobacteraceae bacterium]
MPTSSGAGPPAVDPLIDAVLHASRALVAVAARSLAVVAEDVTLPQYRTLVLLAGQGPQGTAELAAALGASPSTATRMCDRLVRKGLVRRRVRPQDRRQVAVALTEAGRRVVAEVTAHRRAEIARIVRAIPAARRPELVQALSAFAESAGELRDQDWAAGWEL